MKVSLQRMGDGLLLFAKWTTPSLLFVMYMDTIPQLWQEQCSHNSPLNLKLSKPNIRKLISSLEETNDTPDDLKDHIPIRTGQQLRFKASAFINEQFTTVDVWRFLNPDVKEYTWSNNNRSLCSRIDLWLISPSCMEYVMLPSLIIR